MSGRLVFDVSGIDCDDGIFIRQATRRNGEIPAPKMEGTVPEIEQPKRPGVILTQRVTAAFGYATAVHEPKARSDTNTSYARISSQSRC